MKRQVFALAALALAVAVPGASADGMTQHTIRIGDSEEFHFDGKPSTGYRWILNEEESSGLDIVTVESLGYSDPYTRLLGADAPFSFRLTCARSGSAELQFDYLSPAGSTVGDTQIYKVLCE